MDMWRHLHEKLTVFHCLSRPDLPNYPIPPVPAHAACNYAKSHDYVPGNTHPSPPVEHEYHIIDVNYSAADPHAADRMNGSARPPADYKYVCFENCCVITERIKYNITFPATAT